MPQPIIMQKRERQTEKERHGCGGEVERERGEKGEKYKEGLCVRETNLKKQGREESKLGAYTAFAGSLQ